MRTALTERLGTVPIPLPDSGKYYYMRISRGNQGFGLGVVALLLHAEAQNLPRNTEVPAGDGVKPCGSGRAGQQVRTAGEGSPPPAAARVTLEGHRVPRNPLTTLSATPAH